MQAFTPYGIDAFRDSACPLDAMSKKPPDKAPGGCVPPVKFWLFKPKFGFMNVKNALLHKLASLNDLPTLPHILLKLLKACNQDSPDLRAIGELVTTDPALSAKIMRLVNSAHMGLPRKAESVIQAAMLIGTNGIKNVAVCACVYDAFPRLKKNGRFDLKQFWWHALRCAFLGKNMAADWNICSPDEAFLSGLLHDIGKAVLWTHFHKSYDALLKDYGHDPERMLAAEAQMGATHAEVGGWLLDHWQLATTISDCVRYHHETTDRIAQALALVQTIHTANLLCQSTEDGFKRGLASADRLFGRNPMQCQALVAKSVQEASAIARWLDIDVDATPAADNPSDATDTAAQDQLQNQVRHLALTIGTLESLLTAEDRNSLLTCIAESLLILFEHRRCLFFLVDNQRDALVAYLPDPAGRYTQHPQLAVSMQMQASLLIRCLVQKQPVFASGAQPDKPLTIVDEQLMRLLSGSAMCCLPLIALNEPVGVLALGADSENLPLPSENTALLNIVLHHGALALHLENLRRRQLQLVQDARIQAAGDLARQVVHEVNNPLAIIKNFLKALGDKMRAAGIDDKEIRIVSQEISRIGRLLKQLTAFSTAHHPGKQNADLNALLTDLLALTQATLLADAGISVHTDFEANLPTVAIHPDSLKQVVINLIQNAADALSPGGGRIELRTRRLSAPLTEASRHDSRVAGGAVEMVVSDDGPGIPEAIREKLFDPYVGTKDDGHSGLGLAVVHHIIQSFNGSIVCESTPGQGTTFKIVLPTQRGPIIPSGQGAPIKPERILPDP